MVSNEFGMGYLTQVFDPHTRAKAGRGKRLLIVDGHSSHVNLAFLEECNKRRICVLILPPHITQRLQPCGVGAFLPLSTKYSSLSAHFSIRVMGSVACLRDCPMVSSKKLGRRR